LTNAPLQVKTYETRVGSDTEHIFGDDFFENLNGVCNALDNVQVSS
jgi:ubiquitin-activating enzyme E1